MAKSASSPSPSGPASGIKRSEDGGVRYKLRLRAAEIPLPREGSVVIGRDASCDIVFDDPLVSRRHAELTVSPAGVLVTDLQSSNHVFVNGEPIDECQMLQSGDGIVIGGQHLELCIAAQSRAPVRRRDTLTDVRSKANARISDPTRQNDSLHLLGSVADKLLATGNGVEAERVLSRHLERVLLRARSSGRVRPEVLSYAGSFAVRLARAQKSARWMDYAIELYTIAKQPFPIEIIDELYAQVQKLPRIDVRALRAYLAVLAEASASFGPNERFAVQRIAGLEPIAASR